MKYKYFDVDCRYWWSDKIEQFRKISLSEKELRKWLKKNGNPEIISITCKGEVV